MDKLDSLYQLYLDNGLLTSKTSIDQFKEADVNIQEKLYQLGKDNNLFSTTDLSTFQSAWGEVKKKDSSQLQDAVAQKVSRDTPSTSDLSQPSLEQKAQASLEGRLSPDIKEGESDYRLEARPFFEEQNLDIDKYLSLTDRAGQIQEELKSIESSDTKPTLNPLAKTESSFINSLNKGNQSLLEQELSQINSEIDPMMDSVEKAKRSYDNSKFYQLQSSVPADQLSQAVKDAGIDQGNVKHPKLVIDGEYVSLNEYNEWLYKRENINSIQENPNLIPKETLLFLKESNNEALNAAYELTKRQVLSGGEWGDKIESLESGILGIRAGAAEVIAKGFYFGLDALTYVPKTERLEVGLEDPETTYSSEFLKDGGSPLANRLKERQDDLRQNIRAYEEASITESLIKGNILDAVNQGGNALMESAPLTATLMLAGPLGIPQTATLFGAGIVSAGQNELELLAQRKEGEDIADWQINLSNIGSFAGEFIGEKYTLGLINDARRLSGLDPTKEASVIVDSYVRGVAKGFGIEATSEAFTETINYLTDSAVGLEDFDLTKFGLRIADASIIGGFSGAGIHTSIRGAAGVSRALNNLLIYDKNTTVIFTYPDGKKSELSRTDAIKLVRQSPELRQQIRDNVVKPDYSMNSVAKKAINDLVYGYHAPEAHKSREKAFKKARKVEDLARNIRETKDDVSLEQIQEATSALKEMQDEVSKSRFNKGKATKAAEKSLRQALNSKGIKVNNPSDSQVVSMANVTNTVTLTGAKLTDSQYNKLKKQFERSSNSPAGKDGKKIAGPLNMVMSQDKAGISINGEQVQTSEVVVGKFKNEAAALNAMKEYEVRKAANEAGILVDDQILPTNNKIYNDTDIETLEQVPQEVLDNDYHIISPQVEGTTTQESAARMDQLKSELDDAGASYYTIKEVNNGVESESLIITGIDSKKALEVGRNLQQNSVFSSKDGLLMSDGSVVPVNGSQLDGIDARKNDRVSIMNIGGEKVSIHRGLDVSKASFGKTFNADNMHRLDESDPNYDSELFDGVTSDKKRVLGNVLKILNSIGGLNINIVRSSEAMTKQLLSLGENPNASRSSFYNAKDKTIYLNLETLSGNTLFHEVVHPMVDFIKTNDPELYKSIEKQVGTGKKVKRYIDSNGRRQKGTYLQWAEQNYSKLSKEAQIEEAFAEMIGDAANGHFANDASSLSKIRRILNEILSRITKGTRFEKPETVNISELSAKGIEDNIAGALATGRKINVGGVDFEVVDANQAPRFQLDATDRRTGISYSYGVNSEKFSDLIQRGLITNGKTIQDFAGKMMMLHAPDAMFSGSIVDADGTSLVEGKGGVLYPFVFNEEGYFWASTDNAAEKMADQLNSMMSENDGKIYMALTTAPQDKLLSSTAASRGILNLLTSDNFIKKIGINKSELYKAVINAANDVSKKVKIETDEKTGEEVKKIKQVGLGLKLKPYRASSNFNKEVVEKIWNKLDNSTSSFDDRKNFSNRLLTSLLGRESKKTGLKFNIFDSATSKTNFVNFIKTTEPDLSYVEFTKSGVGSIVQIKKAIINILTEPGLREEDGQTNRIYAVLEIDGPVKPVKTDDYESYGTAIVSEKGNRTTIHRLDTKDLWYDVAEEPGTNVVIGGRERLSRSGKMTPIASQVFPSTAGVSMEPLRISSVIREQVPEVEEVQWQESTIGKGDLAITNRREEVREAAQAYFDGEINQQEYLDIVQENSPIKPITQFIDPAKLEDIETAVGKKVEGKLDVPVQEGTKVGLRLDIPAYTNNNIWAITVHEDGRGKAMSYTNVARINNVEFISSPKVALGIARGKLSKSTIARMLGEWSPIQGANAQERGENAKQIVTDVMNDPSWSQVGMNPFRHSYFYDRLDGMPVVNAEQVVQIGGLVYAKNAEKTTPFDDRFADKKTGLRFQAPSYDMEYTPNALLSLDMLSDDNRRPEQWVNEIGKGMKGASRDVSTMGLLDLLKAYKKDAKVKSISKDIVARIIATNMANVETVILSSDSRKPVDYQDFSVELDGNNLFVMFPDGSSQDVNIDYIDYESGFFTKEEVVESALEKRGFESLEDYIGDEYTPEKGPRYSSYTLAGGTNYREFLIKDTSEENIFKAPHYQELGQNLIASARVDDRVGPNGEKVLFVQEIQSDWAQRADDKKKSGEKIGFKKDNPPLTKEEVNEVGDLSATYNRAINEWVKGIKDPWVENLLFESGDYRVFELLKKVNERISNSKPTEDLKNYQRYLQLQVKDSRFEDAIVDLPWGQTDLWVGLTIRKLIHQASKEGYDQIAFVNGEQSDKVQGHTGDMKGSTHEFYNKIIPKNINKELGRLIKGSKYSVSEILDDSRLIEIADFEFAYNEEVDGADRGSMGTVVDEVFTMETSDKREDQVTLTYSSSKVDPESNVPEDPFYENRLSWEYKGKSKSYQYGAYSREQAKEQAMIDLSNAIGKKSKNAAINLTPELKEASNKIGPLRFQKPAPDGEVGVYKSGLVGIGFDIAKYIVDKDYQLGTYLSNRKDKDYRFDQRFTQLISKPHGTHTNDEIKEIMVRSKGEVSAEMLKTNMIVNELKEANKEANLSPSEIDRLLRNLDEVKTMEDSDIKFAIIKMRRHIDSLSRTLIREDMVKGQTQFSIDENLGVYINRSYKQFEVKGWKQTDNDIIQRAKDFLYREIKSQNENDVKAGRLDKDGEPIMPMSEKQISNKVTSELKKLQSKEGFLYAQGKSSSGDNLNMVNSIFKRRKNVPEEIKDLWGEIDNPYYNYVTTVNQLSRTVAAQRMFRELNVIGEGKFISKDASDFANNELNGAKYGDLEGMYVDNEMYAVINKSIEHLENNKFVNSYLKAVLFNKKMKTVWNPSTHAKNIVGNTAFAFMNGHISFNGDMYENVMTSMKAFKSMKEGDFADLYSELTRLGVVSSSASLQEIREIANDIQQSNFDLTEYLDDDKGIIGKRIAKVSRGIKSGIKSADDLFTRMYQAEDDVWKVFGFLSERNRYMRAGIDAATAKQMAARNIIALYPNYNEIPGFIRVLGRSPFVGSFVAFQAEVVRNTKNAIQLGFQELGSDNPNIRKIGVTRVAGTISTFALVESMQLATLQLLGNMVGFTGGEGEELEDRMIRLILPEWDSSGKLATVERGVLDSRQADGQEEGDKYFDYINFSNTSGVGYIKDIMRLALTDIDSELGKQEFDDRVLNILQEVYKPFLGEEMTLIIFREALDNRGNKVYNPTDDWYKRLGDIMLYTGKKIQPGLTKTALRNIEANYAEDSILVPEYEALAILGLRVSRINVNKGLAIKSKFLLRDMEAMIGKGVLSSRAKTLEAYRENEKFTKYVDQMVDLYSTALFNQVSGVDALNILNKIGVPKSMRQLVSEMSINNYGEDLYNVDKTYGEDE